MPSQSSKRRASEARAPMAKKVRADPHFAAVVEAIKMTGEDLPEDVKAMLIAIVPTALGAPADDRHEYQKTAITMFDEVYSTIQGRLERESATAAEAAAACKDDAAAAEAGAEAAAATSAGAKEVEEERRLAHGAAVKRQEEAEAGLEQARVAQRRGDAPLVDAQKQKESCEALYEGDFKALMASADAKKQGKAILKYAGRFQIEDTLLHALSLVCESGGAERSSFDNVILAQVDAWFVERLAHLASTLEAGAAGRAEREAAIEAAETERDAATAAVEVAAAELASAAAACREAAASAREAKAAATAARKTRDEAERTLAEATTTLQSFTDRNVECFTSLVNRVSERVEEPEPAVEHAEEGEPQPQPALERTEEPAVVVAKVAEPLAAEKVVESAVAEAGLASAVAPLGA